MKNYADTTDTIATKKNFTATDTASECSIVPVGAEVLELGGGEACLALLAPSITPAGANTLDTLIQLPLVDDLSAENRWIVHTLVCPFKSRATVPNVQVKPHKIHHVHL